jgi:carbon storage regulator CsrA
MLILSRRAQERIVFPDLEITVQVLEIKGDRVRLGFEAPSSVAILRGELVKFSDPAIADIVAESGPAAEPRPAADRSPTPTLPLRRAMQTALRRIAPIAVDSTIHVESAAG